MLLVHGSRLTNFVGILSKGLKIAPPDVPASGYLFGKGLFFIIHFFHFFFFLIIELLMLFVRIVFRRHVREKRPLLQVSTIDLFLSSFYK